MIGGPRGEPPPENDIERFNTSFRYCFTLIFSAIYEFRKLCGITGV